MTSLPRPPPPSSSPTTFKVTHPDQKLARRLYFPSSSPPSYSVLCSKLVALWGSDVLSSSSQGGSIQLSYVDNEGDRVLLSSEEEWKAFCNEWRGAGGEGVVKMRVVVDGGGNGRREGGRGKEGEGEGEVKLEEEKEKGGGVDKELGLNPILVVDETISALLQLRNADSLTSKPLENDDRSDSSMPELLPVGLAKGKKKKMKKAISPPPPCLSYPTKRQPLNNTQAHAAQRDVGDNDSENATPALEAQPQRNQQRKSAAAAQQQPPVVVKNNNVAPSLLADLTEAFTLFTTSPAFTSIVDKVAQGAYSTNTNSSNLVEKKENEPAVASSSTSGRTLSERESTARVQGFRPSTFATSTTGDSSPVRPIGSQQRHDMDDVVAFVRGFAPPGRRVGGEGDGGPFGGDQGPPISFEERRMLETMMAGGLGGGGSVGLGGDFVGGGGGGDFGPEVGGRGKVGEEGLFEGEGEGGDFVKYVPSARGTSSNPTSSAPPVLDESDSDSDSDDASMASMLLSLGMEKKKVDAAPKRNPRKVVEPEPDSDSSEDAPPPLFPVTASSIRKHVVDLSPSPSPSTSAPPPPPPAPSSRNGNGLNNEGTKSSPPSGPPPLYAGFPSSSTASFSSVGPHRPANYVPPPGTYPVTDPNTVYSPTGFYTNQPNYRYSTFNPSDSLYPLHPTSSHFNPNPNNYNYYTSPARSSAVPYSGPWNPSSLHRRLVDEPERPTLYRTFGDSRGGRGEGSAAYAVARARKEEMSYGRAAGKLREMGFEEVRFGEGLRNVLAARALGKGDGEREKTDEEVVVEVVRELVMGVKGVRVREGGGGGSEEE